MIETRVVDLTDPANLIPSSEFAAFWRAPVLKSLSESYVFAGGPVYDEETNGSSLTLELYVEHEDGELDLIDSLSMLDLEHASCG